MPILEEDIVKKLDREDREKVSYFVKLLIQRSKYRKLREEISLRREEIKKGEVLSHEEVWDSLGV